MSKKRNNLTRKEQRVLEDMLTEYKVSIELGKWSQPGFAVLASEKMNRLVEVTNVGSAAKLMGVEFNPRGEARKSYSPTKMLLVSNQEIIIESLVFLYMEVQRLSEEQVKIPKRLLELWDDNLEEESEYEDEDEE